MSALLIQKLSVSVQVLKFQIFSFHSKTVSACTYEWMISWWWTDKNATMNFNPTHSREGNNEDSWTNISPANCVGEKFHPCTQNRGCPKGGLPDFWGRLVSGSGCRQERPGASSVGTAEPGRPDNGTAGIPPPINRLPWGHGHQGAAQVSAPRWQKSGGRLGANLPSRWTL